MDSVTIGVIVFLYFVAGAVFSTQLLNDMIIVPGGMIADNKNGYN